MGSRRFTVLFMGLLVVTSRASAQTEGLGAAWLSVAYTYNDVSYKEASAIEKGRFAGVRGELGLSIFSAVGFSIGGEYQDGNMNYDGTTLATGQTGRTKNITKDYMRELRGLVHLFYGSMILSTGAAQRFWCDDLITSYRRRQTYDYYPAILTVARGPVYFKAEADIWKKGHQKAYMSDLGTAETDVDFNQTGGTGYAAEIGLLIPSAMKVLTRVFVNYHQWDIKDSDTQSDGVYSLSIPKNSTTILQAGIGLDF